MDEQYTIVERRYANGILGTAAIINDLAINMPSVICPLLSAQLNEIIKLSEAQSVMARKLLSEVNYRLVG